MKDSPPPPLPKQQPPVLPGRRPPPLPQKPKSVVWWVPMPTKLNQMCRTDSKLTFVGVVLAALTAILSLGFALFLPFWLLPRLLPPGTRYPVLVIGIATVLFGALFFAGGAWALDQLGLPATQP